jgi:hypothetical protein
MFDRDVAEDVVLKNPELYSVGREGQDLNPKALAGSTLHAFFVALIIFGVACTALQGLFFNGIDDYWSFGCLCFTMLVIGVNFRATYISSSLNSPCIILQLMALGIYGFFLVRVQRRRASSRGEQNVWRTGASVPSSNDVDLHRGISLVANCNGKRHLVLRPRIPAPDSRQVA